MNKTSQAGKAAEEVDVPLPPVLRIASITPEEAHAIDGILGSDTCPVHEGKTMPDVDIASLLDENRR